MGVLKIPKSILKTLKDYDDEIEVSSINSVKGGCINEAYRYVTNKGDFFVKVIIFFFFKKKKKKKNIKKIQKKNKIK